MVIDKPQRKHPARKITYLSSPPAKYWSSKHLHSCVLKSFSQTFPATQLVLRSSFCHNITSVRYDDDDIQPVRPHNRTRGVALISASIKAEPNSSVFVATDTMTVGPSEPTARMTLFSLHRKSPYRYGGSLVCTVHWQWQLRADWLLPGSLVRVPVLISQQISGCGRSKVRVSDTAGDNNNGNMTTTTSGKFLHVCLGEVLK